MTKTSPTSANLGNDHELFINKKYSQSGQYDTMEGRVLDQNKKLKQTY